MTLILTFIGLLIISRVIMGDGSSYFPCPSGKWFFGFFMFVVTIIIFIGSLIGRFLLR